jgi:hypothetical protein
MPYALRILIPRLRRIRRHRPTRVVRAIPVRNRRLQPLRRTRVHGNDGPRPLVHELIWQVCGAAFEDRRVDNAPVEVAFRAGGVEEGLCDDLAHRAAVEIL